MCKHGFGTMSMTTTSGISREVLCLDRNNRTTGYLKHRTPHGNVRRFCYPTINPAHDFVLVKEAKENDYARPTSNACHEVWRHIRWFRGCAVESHADHQGCT